MVAKLNKEDMTCNCPNCNKIINVSEDDFDSIMDDGHIEYWICCPYCHKKFYTSENY